MRLCARAGCGEPPVGSYCRAHTRQRDRQHRSANRWVYDTKRWRVLRRRKLALSPVCESCRQVLATDVHHRLAIQAGGEAWSLNNLESLCKSCHSIETRREQVT